VDGLTLEPTVAGALVLSAAYLMASAGRAKRASQPTLFRLRAAAQPLHLPLDVTA
jgi:hypothetical protein